ncbi:MAG: ATP-binding protein, partial [Candidatus Limnocylindria bacterium]
MLRDALRPSALLPGLLARAIRPADRPAHRALDDARGLERALFLGRCIGGGLVIVLGPPAVAGADARVFYLFGVYFIAYALLTLWLSERAGSIEAQRRAGWVAHVFDTVGFIGGLLLSALAPSWLVTNAAPLYIVIVAFRFGTRGAAFAVGAISIAHLAIAAWRVEALGHPLDPADTAIHLGIYVLAGLITAGIEGEVRSLRAGREMQMAVHDPLLRAHDDMELGVLVTEAERAVYVSDGLVSLSGWSRDEIMALSSVYDLIPEDERASARDISIALPGDVGVLQKTLMRKDGRRIDVEVALRRYPVGRGVRTVAIIRDVTFRLRTLAELERTHRLESLGSLAGGIAHDFNNLLAVILNNTHLALAAGGPAASREIEEIQQAAERGAQLTRQMLVFSRGGTTPAQLIEVGGEVASAERFLRRTIGPGVSLDVRLADGLPAVKLGAGQVEQILMNLALNARDAMPAGGRLSVAIDEVEIDATAAASTPALRPGRQLRIAVEDTGSGMAPEVASRVFEPFFTTKPKGRGTGLGLSTVYGIVTRAGGHIGLASTLGAGTRFTIHLPAFDSETADDVAEPAPLEQQGHGGTILLVDDEPSVLRTTSAILRGAGYRVVEALTPSDALLAATHDFDMLISDIVLPGITGRELAKHIRERR